MNFKDLEQHFITTLAPMYNAEEARQHFFITAEQLSASNRTQLLMDKFQELDVNLTPAYEKVLMELQSGKPIQHIFAEAWFYGLKFKVSGAVLIPRPETEELVEWILSSVKADYPAATKTPAILDVGTGSGCIAVTLKKMLPLAEISAMDISPAALAVASDNAAHNNVGINFIHADILQYTNQLQYDLIVSNPPYITEEERAAMHQNVLEHEPHLALFVPDDNPLLFYKAIADFAMGHLNINGKLFFEINEYLGKETVDMLCAKGFKNIDLKKDMQGKDRMICCNL